MTILVLSGLSDKKLTSKLLPLLKLEFISTLILFRHRPLDIHNLECISTHRFKRLPHWMKEIIRIWQIIMYLRTHKVDYIIGFRFWPHMVLSYWMSRLFKRKWIAAFTGCPKRSSNKIFYRSMINHADRIIVRGSYSKKILIDQGVDDGKVFIQSNFHEFSPISLECRDKDYDLIFAGNLIPIKNPDFLITVIDRLKAKLPTIQVAIAGDGPLSSKLKKQVARLGLNDNIHFLGTVEDIDSVLLRSKVLIMTSVSEGLPMIMIEALSQGLPVIVPDVGDVRDVALDRVNSRIITPLDLNGYVEACKELLLNEQQYIDMAGQARLIRSQKSQEYGLANITNKWRQILL